MIDDNTKMIKIIKRIRCHFSSTAIHLEYDNISIKFMKLEAVPLKMAQLGDTYQ